ncbi:MFS transporter [Pseudonocardia yunnanensis]|uniref:MFS transporter n=1 Tax=Pseudonocardia yunnanensis TaxID=58107 RepID=A0ABW4F7E1_9PSEU
MLSRTLGWLTLFLVGTDLFVMSPLLPEISRGFAVGISAGGWAVSVFAVAYLVGGPSLAALADRAGRRGVLIAALAVFAVANLATALAPSFAVLLGARAMAGLAASGITPSVYALVSAAAPPGARATWLSIVTSGLLIALTIGAPAGSLLASAVGWQGVFLVLAVAAALILASTVAWTRRAAPAPTAGATTTAGTSDQHRLEPAPAVVTKVRAVSVTALWALAVYGLYTYLGTILREHLGFPPSVAAGALVCFGAGAVIGNLSGGRLADRFGGRQTSVITLVLLAGAETLFGLALHAGPVLLLASLAGMALVAYPFFSAQQARLIARYPAASSSLIAWNNTAMYAGILIGSALGGTALTYSGPALLAFAAAGVALLAAFVATSSITTPS